MINAILTCGAGGRANRCFGKVVIPPLPALLVGVFGLGGCARPPIAEVYPQVSEHAGREIEEVTFVNPEPFSEDSVDTLTETEETECRIALILPFCFPGTDWGRRERRLDLRMLGDDVRRLTLLYRRSGYFGTVVVPEIEELEGDDGPIEVRFLVRRGDGVVMDSVIVQGTEGIVDPDSLQQELPLQPGELFDVGELLASADTVTEALRGRGHAYAEVLRNYQVDTVRDRATAWLVAVPGPRVVVDSIRVTGLDQLGRSDVLRQLTFEDGDLLRLSSLRSSQRNLYELELVQFASVSIAPDSLQAVPGDSTRATVNVTLSEAAEHVVETSAGWGHVECFRFTGQWTDRSFFAGARKLAINGSLSRVGLGDPVGGLGGTLCRPDEGKRFGAALDYRLAAELTQPFFVTPRNRIVAGAFVERQSEPGLFQRTAQGASFALTHRLGTREVLSATLGAEHRITDASVVFYCFEFRACTTAEIEPLLSGRWRNTLGVGWVRDRSNRPLDPTAGYVTRSNLLWATPLLASDHDFLRLDAEGAMYRSIGGGWVLAGFLRLGSFLTAATIGTEDFIPPEERFFAGGANSVRGYERFALGPGIYLLDPGRVDPDTVFVADPELPVDFFPTGGTSVGVASLEARFPSPFLRDLMRLAVFVDAGSVALDAVWEGGSQWRATPGFGARFQTPVGPARVDLAYDPYPPPRGRLYAPTEDGGLRRLDDDGFEPTDDRSFFGRFQLHIAVGQAF